MKKLVLNIGKLALAAGLITYLVQSGKLNFAQLNIYLNDGWILTFAVLQFALFFVCGGSLRWYLLLVGLKLPVMFKDVIRLQMIGLFFNTVMPGAVGGDLVKAIYVVRGQSAAGKTTAMLSVLVDRVCGLIGLFVFAGVVIIINFSFIWELAALRPFVLMIFGIFIAVVCGFLVTLLPSNDRDFVAKILSKDVIGFHALKKIYTAFRCYREHPMTLFWSVMISVVNQACLMGLFWLVASRLTGTEPSFGAFATVVPIGMLATAVPLAPGGMGVGHVAFERLLAIAGVGDGANIFNVVMIGMLSLNLLGAIPYLSYRGQISIKDAKQQPLTDDL